MEKTVEKMAFERYPLYKDSGVDWLGEIPNGWELRRFKYLFKEINERSNDGSEDLLSVSQYTGVTKKSDDKGEGDLITTASTLEGYKKVYKNDLVSNIMLAWNGSLGFSPFDGITSPAYSIYRLQPGNSERFFHYLVRSEIFKSEFKRNSSGVIESRLRLYTDNFFSIWSLLPPLSEQTAIARFLDEKTAKIDKAIAQKEKLIELLKERKQIIIQDLVTGKKVWNEAQQAWTSPSKTKDSGVEWIGEIPEGWEVKRLKSQIDLLTGFPFQSNKYADFGIKLARGINVKEGVFNWDDLRCWPQITKDLVRYTLKDGDILIAMDGSKVGKNFCQVQEKDLPVLLLQRVARLRPTNSLNKDFLFWNIASRNFLYWVNISKTDPMVPHIAPKDINDFLISTPPIEVQSAIATHIKTQSANIDKAIRLQEHQIEKLKEYKAHL